MQIADAENRLDQYPHELSGGMRQRFMIAMALICGPRILIADEPTTALDVTIQAQILDLMRDLKRRLDTAIILITHNLGVVAEMAERVIVMYAGRKVEEADVLSLFDRPLHIPDPRPTEAGPAVAAGIAIALACQPRLLIADEPTTALDVTIQAQILELLKDLQREHGMGLLLITHDLAVVAGMAHRVALMYAGQIIGAAPADEFFCRATSGSCAPRPSRSRSSRARHRRHPSAH